MKIKKVAISILILFCFSFSCKKKNYDYNSTIEGYAIDYVTKDSIADATIQIWEDDRGGSNRLSDFDRIVATTKSDDKGFYNINYTGSMLKYYGLTVGKTPYFINPDVNLVNDVTKNLNPYLIPLSWLKIHIKNEPPALPSDSIYFYYNISFLGQNVDSTFFREFKTTTPQLNIWDVTINSITTQYSQTTSCSPFDTYSLNIIY